MKRELVVGDIHGGYKALEEVCERAGVDRKTDRLICLGDVCDGWPEVPEAFESLREFDDLIYILGNHDAWTLNWMDGTIDDHQFKAWFLQGGKATISAYERRPDLKEKHHRFLKEKAHPFFVDDNSFLYVHGGFDLRYGIDEQPDPEIFYWDRTLQEEAWHRRDEQVKLGGYEKIFIGHTQTLVRGTDQPMKNANVWCLDTGATSVGPLTVMDVHTEEYWQSTPVQELYPGHEGR